MKTVRQKFEEFLSKKLLVDIRHMGKFFPY